MHHAMHGTSSILHPSILCLLGACMTADAYLLRTDGLQHPTLLGFSLF